MKLFGSFGDSDKIEDMFADAELSRQKQREKEKEKLKDDKGKEKEERDVVKGGVKRKRWEVEQLRRDEERKLKGLGVKGMTREVRSDGEQHECDNCKEVCFFVSFSFFCLFLGFSSFFSTALLNN